MKNPFRPQAALGLMIFAIQIGASSSGSAATREYLFSGPSVTGRFIVEEFTVSTPNPNEELLQWSSPGAPFLFSATAGNLSYATDNFQLVVRNSLVAFGRSDQYSLEADNLRLVLMGPTLGLPYTSTLPHDVEAYAGLHYLQLADPATGGWAEFQITSLTPVPEPSMLCFAVLALGCWAVARHGIRPKKTLMASAVNISARCM